MVIDKKSNTLYLFEDSEIDKKCKERDDVLVFTFAIAVVHLDVQRSR